MLTSRTIPCAGLLQREYADDKKPSTGGIPKIPAYETTTAAASDPPSLKSQPQVDPKGVPLSPPNAKPIGSSNTAAASPTPSPPPPPPPSAPVKKKKKGFFRRLRNYLLTLIFLGAVSFGGGVWYSRINDNFHDFFTEYIPFGEQAVLYLEELDFQKRYPRMSWGGSHGKDRSENVRIQPQSGASWRVADSGEPAGRQTSAVLQAKDAAASSSASSSASASASSSSRDSSPAPSPKPKPEATEDAVAVAKSSAPAVEKSAKKKVCMLGKQCLCQEVGGSLLTPVEV